MKRNGILFVGFLTICTLAFGENLWPRAAAQTGGDTYAIRNARIVTVSGPVIDKGTVVIANGKIVAVGADVQVPANARVIDATNLSVYPGMIDAGSEIGLTEISSVSGSLDTAEIGDNNANIRVDVAIHPDSSHIGVTRVNGITTALTAPQGGLIAGQSALINLDGWVPRDMILKTPVAMHINWPGGLGLGHFAAAGYRSLFRRLLRRGPQVRCTRGAGLGQRERVHLPRHQASV